MQTRYSSRQASTQLEPRSPQRETQALQLGVQTERQAFVPSMWGGRGAGPGGDR